jgi:hypothetical protein
MVNPREGTMLCFQVLWTWKTEEEKQWLLKCQSAEVTADKPVRKMKAKFPRQAGWWVGAPPGPHLAHYLLTTRHGCAVAVFHECQSC